MLYKFFKQYKCAIISNNMIYQTTNTTNTLQEVVFNRHKLLSACDELQIISGYIGPDPVTKLSELPFNTKVVYGMYRSSGIKIQEHNKYIDIQNKNKNVEIFYSSQPVHSKLYLWKHQNRIISVLLGSANFSYSSLTAINRELLTDVSQNNFTELSNYSDLVLSNSNLCIDINIADTSKSKKTSTELDEYNSLVCTMPLYDPKTGQVQKYHGLNWGQNPKNHTTKRDACIPIRVNHIKRYPDLFPEKKGFSSLPGGRIQRTNDPIELMFDDGEVMTCVLEGSQPVKNYNEEKAIYPKQLTSFPAKATIGEYFRYRLGVATDDPVTIEHLRSYGRDSIELSILSEGVYYANFAQL